MTDNTSNNPSLFTYLDQKAEELRHQREIKKAQQTKPVNPEAERRRHEYDKSQGMI